MKFNSTHVILTLLITLIIVLSGCTQQSTNASTQDNSNELPNNSNGLIEDTSNGVTTDNSTNSTNANSNPETQKYAFDLKTAEMKFRVSDDGKKNIQALEFTYSTNITKELHIALIDPAGNVKEDWVDVTGSSWVEVYNQLGGEYQLIIYDPEARDADFNPVILFDKNFTFLGPQITVTNAEVNGWDPNHALGWNPSSFLVTVKNTGDLPFKTQYAIVVDRALAEQEGFPSSSYTSNLLALGESYYVNPDDAGYNSPGWVNPGEKTYAVSLQWSLSTGTHQMELLVIHNSNKVIQTFPFTLTTP